MANKRVSRTDDSQYWNDPDYHEALAEVGLEMTLPSTASPPPTEVDTAGSSSGQSVVAKIIQVTFTLIQDTVMLVIFLLKGLHFWLSISPAIWIFNLVCHTHIPGIEVPIVLFIQLLATSPHSHVLW